jgi:CBS domain
MAGFHLKHKYYPYQQTGSDWSYHARKVITLPTTAHIVELLPLIVNQGHHHVPIVDEDGRFWAWFSKAACCLHCLMPKASNIIPESNLAVARELFADIKLSDI